MEDVNSSVTALQHGSLAAIHVPSAQEAEEIKSGGKDYRSANGSWERVGRMDEQDVRRDSLWEAVAEEGDLSFAPPT